LEKLIVIVEDTGRGAPFDPPAAVEALQERIAPHVEALTVHMAGRVVRTDLLDRSGEDSSGGSLFDGSLYCALSIWMTSADQAADLFDRLDFLPGRRTIYSVVEAAVRDYDAMNWPLGSASPGATLLALFRRKAGMSRDEFRARWSDHSKLSLRRHPLVRYHRNLIVHRVLGEGGDWDGIVEERVGSLADLAPERFYIGEGVREQASADTATFIDVEHGMRCNLLTEYILKPPRWLRVAAPGHDAVE
jgi:hypothetical protein